jgi:hypothetical protein
MGPRPLDRHGGSQRLWRWGRSGSCKPRTGSVLGVIGINNVRCRRGCSVITRTDVVYVHNNRRRNHDKDQNGTDNNTHDDNDNDNDTGTSSNGGNRDTHTPTHNDRSLGSPGHRYAAFATDRHGYQQRQCEGL